MDLPDIGEEVPGFWPSIREALAQEKAHYISLDRLREVSRAHGLEKPMDVEVMTRVFHRLGVYTHFADDELLRERVFLDSNWLCQVLYKLLDDEVVKEAKGRLSKAVFQEIWKDNELAFEIEKLITLLQKFSLVYPVPQKQQFVVPAHLPESMPYAAWAHEREAQVLPFVYEFDNYMPKGLIPRLIVGLYHHIQHHDQVWLYGFNIVFEGATAEIKEESLQSGAKKNRIIIRVAGGRPEHKTNLLAIVRELLEKQILEKDYPSMKYERLVPCNCNTCKDAVWGEKHLYRLQKLTERLSNQKRDISCENPPYEDVSVAALLGAVELNQEAQAKLQRQDREIRKKVEAINLTPNPMNPTIQKALSRLDEADRAGFFEIIEPVVPTNLKSTFSQLRGIFISGKAPWDFDQQLRVFAQSIEDATNAVPIKPNDDILVLTIPTNGNQADSTPNQNQYSPLKPKDKMEEQKEKTPIWENPIVKWVGGSLGIALITVMSYFGLNPSNEGEKQDGSKSSHFIIEGRLVDHLNNPLKNQQVVINGKSAFTDTQNGTFSARGVEIGKDGKIEFAVGQEILLKDSTEYDIKDGKIHILQAVKITIKK
jgi:hypothetical protein